MILLHDTPQNIACFGLKSLQSVQVVCLTSSCHRGPVVCFQDSQHSKSTSGNLDLTSMHNHEKQGHQQHGASTCSKMSAVFCIALHMSSATCAWTGRSRPAETHGARSSRAFPLYACSCSRRVAYAAYDDYMRVRTKLRCSIAPCDAWTDSLNLCNLSRLPHIVQLRYPGVERYKLHLRSVTTCVERPLTSRSGKAAARHFCRKNSFGQKACLPAWTQTVT